MGRFKITYPRRDAVSEARTQPVSQATQQRQAQASAYAAARFNEWQANSQQREQSLQYRNQILQSQAEMAGLKQMSDLYNQGEIDRETKMYLAGMPALREQLKNANIKPGSEEYRAEISAFAQHIPHAFVAVPAIRDELKQLSHVDATAAEIADKIKTFKQGYKDATGQDPTKVHVGANNEVTGDAPIGIPEKIADRYSRLQGAIELHKDLAARQLKDDMANNRQNMPYADQPKLSAAMKDASILEKAYPTLTTLGQGNQGIGQVANTATAPVAGVTPTPTPVATPSPTPQVTPSPTPDQTPAQQAMVSLTAPDGTIKQVPQDQSDFYIQRGATLNQ